MLFCGAWSGSKLFAKVISRWQKSPLVEKELKVGWEDFFSNGIMFSLLLHFEVICHLLIFFFFFFFCHTCLSMGNLGVQVSVHSSFCQHLHWVSCECNSSYSFVPIFLKLCMCFRHGMKMCMCFECNCQIIFCHFFHVVNFVIFHLSV